MLARAILFTLSVAAGAALAQAPAPDSGKPGSIERGRYLARVAGCNDCHTAGYPQSGGNVPEKQWLLGDRLGWQGPWGTTYAPNLRLSLAKMSEQEWIRYARTTQLRPPMPWFSLRDMSTDDLQALYRFVRQLGPAGEPAPAFKPPGQPVEGPVVRFPG
jgi:mono/diheme cytochrome c family protein